MKETRPENPFANFREDPELLRMLFDVSPTLVFVKDRQGKFVFANRSLAEVYSTTVEGLIGKTDAKFNPDVVEIDRFRADDLRVMDTQEELFIPQEKVSGPDGATVWLQTTKRPLVDPCGECNHVLGVSVDITQRVEAEQRGVELRERLAQAERMESLGVMAGGIAHDLNNILGPIVAYPDLIRPALQGQEDALELLTDLSKSAQRATSVIRDLLTLARRGLYEETAIDANEAIQLFTSSAIAKQLDHQNPLVTLSLDFAEDLPPILGSKPHMHQVVLNLVKNAYDAIEDQGAITVDTALIEGVEAQCHFEELSEEPHVRIRVRDTGQGISPGDQPRIFEPFFSTKISEGAGTGLGLSMVYGLVQDMGGYVDVESVLGQGTVFTMLFPVVKGLEISQPKPDVTPASGTGRILVIDDIVTQRRVTSRLLTSMGYQVETASSGPEGLEKIKTQAAFDLVMIDMMMPTGGDGLDTYRAIQKARPGLACILQSGCAETERSKTALSEGALLFLAKPYSQSTLGETVANAIGSRRS